MVPLLYNPTLAINISTLVSLKKREKTLFIKCNNNYFLNVYFENYSMLYTRGNVHVFRRLSIKQTYYGFKLSGCEPLTRKGCQPYLIFK